MARFFTMLALPILIASSILLAIFSSSPPKTVSRNAPPTLFSAERAMATVGVVGQLSHPTGSPEAVQVRKAIASRLHALGLSVTSQRTTGVGLSSGSMPTAQAGDVETLIGVLPGSDRTLPAVAIMAHTDSVPGSPGAADDGIGVAVAIETARAISSGKKPLRDLMLILTDGEEAGLLGARAFFSSNARARHIGALINVDSRGTSGLGTMFETGPGSGGLIALYRAQSTHRFAHSAATFLYHQLPNRTDLTTALGSNIPALNFAFLDGEFDYHTPRDRIASIDPRTIQSLGDQVFPVVQALAVTRVLPPRGEDGVFGDAPGIVALRYPAWVGWPLLILTVLIGGWAAVGANRGNAARAFTATLWIGVTTALVASLGYGLTGVGSDWAEHHRLMAGFLMYQIALALLGSAVLLTGGAALRSGIHRRWSVAGGFAVGCLTALLGRPLMPTVVMTVIAMVLGAIASGRPMPVRDLRAGSLAAGLTASLALQILAPSLTPLLLWPTLAAAVGAAWSRVLPYPAIATAMLGILPLAYILAFGHAVLLALGIPTPEAIGLFAMIAAVIILPLTEYRQFWGAGAIVLVASALLISFRFSEATERHPALSQIFGVTDERGQSWRVSPVERPDSWTMAQLRAGEGTVERAYMPMISDGRVWRAAVPRVEGAPPAISVLRQSASQVVTVSPARGGREIRLDFVTDRPLSMVAINGVPLLGFANRPGRWKLHWQSSGSPVTLGFHAPPGTRMKFMAAEISQDRLELPTRPDTVVPWLGSDRIIRIAELPLII